ncbi:hypothetical protein BDQ12DRAFT_696474 [Crucibulum laeve]|uniref:SMP-LTD domain-containing protein n=1 Tax=Crucibulum laeve TaxID=68775 RepID=A0A5C3MAK8_9AGAR|nr:hypothetical protein BDQ12DRAFT_696474 [Crucibulum laeve]
MFKALLYAYILGGLTFIPLLIAGFIFITIYTSVPIGDGDLTKRRKAKLEAEDAEVESSPEREGPVAADINDLPRTRKSWLTMRRTFEESPLDGGYVTLVRSLLDARSKDPKRSRPKDSWFVVLKGKVLYLYEDEEMTECEAAVELSGHDVVIYPEGLPDGELFAKRNCICLKPKVSSETMPSVTKEMKIDSLDIDEQLDKSDNSGKKQELERERLLELEKKKEVARDEAMDPSTPWFIFVRSNVEMEDWYFALIHASNYPTQTPTLHPLRHVFEASDMNHLVSTLDEQPDVIPMRWLNALIGRIFFSFYRTRHLEAYIIGRLMKKLSKVKRPNFLTDIVVTEVSVGNKAPMLSKPMLKELTKEGDASIEVHLQYKGEIRITVEATATINIGTFKSYTVKLVLAAVLKELEGNMLIKVKRPPSNRIWYAFTQTPRMVLEVEPIVSDRQITWNMILSTIESKFKEIIQESVVMPNMDDIAFFESLPYQHRGGIWSDASRKHAQPPIGVPVATDSQSVAFAPIPEMTTVLTTPLEPTPLKHAHSTDEVVSGTPSSPPPNKVTRSTSSTPTADESPDSRSTRRRTWFSSVRSDNAALSAPDFFTSEPEINPAGQIDDSRGRTSEIDNISSPRSRSTPSKQEFSPVSTTHSSEIGDSESSHSPSHLSPQSARQRSTSQHSVERESQGSDTYAATSSLSMPSTPRKVSDASQASAVNRAASPTSFFSTLKSKAGDKQAISNTAKEAMRKWGVNVNWGGLKKDMKPDSNASGSSGDDDSAPSSSSSSRLRPDQTNGSAHKARASYAEVRAAVAERKERERGYMPDDVFDSQSASTSIPIPDAPKSKAPTLDTSTPLNDQAGTRSSLDRSTSTTSSTPRLSATTLSSKKSSSSNSRVNTDMDAEDTLSVEKPKHAPIHVQPQAKTMTIPGIHASHRGEVMSMGYVAPQPTPAPPDSKLKNPAIQSVYRLWKSPALTSQEQGGQMQQEPQPPISERQESAEKDNDVVSLVLSPSLQQQPQTVARPTPPPLPPRSTPIAVSRPPVETSAASAETSSPPTTSEALLKSIASKDETARTSLEQSASRSPPATTSPRVEAAEGDADTQNISGSPDEAAPTLDPVQSNLPPALPPRRVQASA